MSYEKEEDERSEINWDHVSGEGVQFLVRSEWLGVSSTPCGAYFAPPHRQRRSPPPISRGRALFSL